MNRYEPLTYEEHKIIGDYFKRALKDYREVMELMKKSVCKTKNRSSDIEEMFLSIFKQWILFSDYCTRDMYLQKGRLWPKEKNKWEGLYYVE